MHYISLLSVQEEAPKSCFVCFGCQVRLWDSSFDVRWDWISSEALGFVLEMNGPWDYPTFNFDFSSRSEMYFSVKKKKL